MEKALLILVILNFESISNSNSQSMVTIQQLVPNDECVELYQNLAENIKKEYEYYHVSIAGGCFLHGKRLPD